jgi:molybdopterin converting factor small subunit
VSRVRIPPVLREAVGGSRELPAAGGTVAEVLDGLFEGHPALAERLRPDGTLSAFVNVYINGDDIRHRQGLETPVTPDDVVILLPAMAGGSACGRAPQFSSRRRSRPAGAG